MGQALSPRVHRLTRNAGTQGSRTKMAEAQYNPDDMVFLTSRSLDEELSEAERSRLEKALGLSDALRREAERLRAVDKLVKRWGCEQADLDWEHHHALISAQAAGDESEASEKLDALLARWGAAVVPLDEKRFAGAVMARVAPARARRLTQRLVFRVGVPLAAAAMLALTLTGRPWFQTVRTAVVVYAGSKQAPVEAPGAPPRAAPVVVVSFAREPVETVAKAGTPRISFGSTGATPLPVMPEEVPPI